MYSLEVYKSFIPSFSKYSINKEKNLFPGEIKRNGNMISFHVREYRTGSEARRRRTVRTYGDIFILFYPLAFPMDEIHMWVARGYIYLLGTFLPLLPNMLSSCHFENEFGFPFWTFFSFFLSLGFISSKRRTWALYMQYGVYRVYEYTIYILHIVYSIRSFIRSIWKKNDYCMYKIRYSVFQSECVAPTYMGMEVNQDLNHVVVRDGVEVHTYFSFQ